MRTLDTLRLRGVGLVIVLGALLHACPAPRPSQAVPSGMLPPVVARYVQVEATTRGSAAVHARLGSLIADRRVELVEGPAAHWSVLHGRFGVKPAVHSLPALDDCRHASVAAFEDGLVLSCEPMAHPDRLLLFSADLEANDPSERVGTCGSGGFHALWPASAEGALLIEGACALSEGDGFHSAPPVWRTPEGELRVVEERAADLPAMVFATRFAPRGDFYLLGDDSGGDTFLLTSIDSGRTFRRRSLPSIQQDGATYEPRLLGHIGTLRVEDDGYLVILIREMETRRWIRYVSHDHGETLEGRLLTIEADAIDLAGARGYAYSELEEAWETNDAGATWHVVPPPPPRPDSIIDLTKLVVCGDGGCLIDSTIERVGWSLPRPSGS